MYWIGFHVRRLLNGTLKPLLQYWVDILTNLTQVHTAVDRVLVFFDSCPGQVTSFHTNSVACFSCGERRPQPERTRSRLLSEAGSKGSVPERCVSCVSIAAAAAASSPSIRATTRVLLQCLTHSAVGEGVI